MHKKKVGFGKLAFLQQNGAIFAKHLWFWPFRTTFSVKNFGPLLCEQWSARTFGGAGGIPCFLRVFYEEFLGFFERFSLLFHGSWGFGRDKNPCFFGGFRCLFQKNKGRTGCVLHGLRPLDKWGNKNREISKKAPDFLKLLLFKIGNRRGGPMTQYCLNLEPPLSAGFGT